MPYYKTAIGQSNDVRPLRVFLAHSSTDKLVVRHLYQRLQNEGFLPWLDEENLLPGQAWGLEIQKAIRAADVVLICLSKASLTRTRYIQKELKYALDLAEEQPEGAIFMIPVKLEECEVPERLNRWHWVNLYEEQGFERLIRALHSRASTLQGNVDIVRRLVYLLQSAARVADTSSADPESFIGRVSEALQEFSSVVGLTIQGKEVLQGFVIFLLRTGDTFEDLRLPNPIPVLVSHKREFSDTFIEDLRRCLTNGTVRSNGRTALLILFSDAVVLDLARRRIASVLSDVYAYDVVVLDARNLINIAQSLEPQRALRRLVLSQVNLTAVAPYVITGPTPEDFFFGREHELREITEHAANVSLDRLLL
jgi:hypothetical protein